MADVDLQEYFNDEQPFGPIVTPDIDDKDAFQPFFDTKNTIAKNLKTRSPYILGRRGAGKTAFLHSHIFEKEYQYVVLLSADDAFPQMIRRIENKLPPNILVEEVAKLWEALLWTAVFSSIYEKHKNSRKVDIQKIKKYLSSKNKLRENNYYTMMKVILDAVEKINNKTKALVDAIENFTLGGVTFREAKESAINILEKENCKSIILVDSLEEFPLSEEIMQNTMKGFIHAIGQIYRSKESCEVRCCLPSELYPSLNKMSSNPTKDFERTLTLHWKSSELLHMSALRFIVFLKTNYPEVYISDFSDLDMSTKQGLRDFWSRILPKTIKNRIGGTENPLAYIMRHTQLLPRHLLLFLNEIAVNSINQNKQFFRFDQDSIVKGVRNAEHKILNGIFSGYKFTQPNAEDTCTAILPNVEMVFDLASFHKAFTRHRGRIPSDDSFGEALTSLIEIGAVGLVRPQYTENERYTVGEFEYTLPYKMQSRSDDLYCVHPVFVEEYRTVDNGSLDDKRPIYPIGTDIEL